MTEILNQYSGWMALIALLFTIPLGIIANLLSPNIHAWIDKRSIKNIGKRISILNLQLNDVERELSEPTYALARLLHKLLVAIMGLILLILFSIFQIMLSLYYFQFINKEELRGLFQINEPKSIIGIITGLIIGILVSFYCSRGSIEFSKMTKRIINYTEWKKEVEKEVEQLTRLYHEKYTKQIEGIGKKEEIPETKPIPITQKKVTISKKKK